MPGKRGGSSGAPRPGARNRDPEFRKLAHEVFSFGLSEGKSTNLLSESERPRFAPKKKLPRLPLTVWQKTVAKRKREEESKGFFGTTGRHLSSAPGNDDPLAEALTLGRQREEKKRRRANRDGSDNLEGHLLASVSDRSGMRDSIGDGSREIRATGIGKFKDGVLTIDPTEISARRGGGQRGGGSGGRESRHESSGKTTKERKKGGKGGFMRKGGHKRRRG